MARSQSSPGGMSSLSSQTGAPNLFRFSASAKLRVLVGVTKEYVTSHRVPLGTVLSIAWCSARLAIVLRALNVLVRGFQEADRAAHPAVLAEALRHNPSHIYGGMLTTLMRMVFVLYGEDRSLMGSDETWLQNYSISGLYERLRADAG